MLLDSGSVRTTPHTDTESVDWLCLQGKLSRLLEKSNKNSFLLITLKTRIFPFLFYLLYGLEMEIFEVLGINKIIEKTGRDLILS